MIKKIFSFFVLSLFFMIAGCASDTAVKVQHATDGAAASCGLYSNTLPGAAVCLGVQAVNFSAGVAEKISSSVEEKNTSDGDVYEGFMPHKKGFWEYFFSLPF